MAVSLNAVMAAGNQGDTHSGDDVGSLTATAAITVAGGATLLVVTIGWHSTSETPTNRAVTWNGVAMTEAAFASHTADGVPYESVGIYTLVSPATGAQTIAATWTTITGTADVYMGAIAFSGTDTATGINAGDTATALTGSAINVAGSSDGATVATFLSNGAEPTTSKTKFWGYDALSPGGAGDYETGGTGTQTHTFSGAGGSKPAMAAIHVIAPAGGGTSITPSAGSLAATGAAPSVTQQIVRTALVGALALVGIAPVLNQSGIRQPTAGALTLAGAAPVVAVQGTIRPSAGALTITGNAPTVVAPQLIQPNVGALALSGNAPTVAVTGNVSRTPSPGALALVGDVSPQTLTVPSPPAAALTITGAAPSMKLGTVRQPSVGAIALTGIAAAVKQGAVRQPVAGALVLTGSAPTVAAEGSRTLTPSVGSLALSGLPANVAASNAVSRTPAPASLAITGNAPGVIQFSVRQPAVAALALTGLAPTVAQSRLREPSTGAIALAGAAPVLVVQSGGIATGTLQCRAYRRGFFGGRVYGPGESVTITVPEQYSPYWMEVVGTLPLNWDTVMSRFDGVVDREVLRPVSSADIATWISTGREPPDDPPSGVFN